MTSCPSAGGSSAGPVFPVDANGKVSLAGIMIAATDTKSSLAMPVTAWRALVESTEIEPDARANEEPPEA